jgi:hypothetical protein
MALHPLATRYPGRAPLILAKIEEIEVELDATWPGWRMKQPFGHLAYDHLARVKWLLKRHSLLTYEQKGIPEPRDWKVVVVRDAANPSKCFAHPVIPDRQREEAPAEPPPVVHIARAEVTP